MVPKNHNAQWMKDKKADVKYAHLAAAVKNLINGSAVKIMRDNFIAGRFGNRRKLVGVFRVIIMSSRTMALAL